MHCRANQQSRWEAEVLLSQGRWSVRFAIGVSEQSYYCGRKGIVHEPALPKELEQDARLRSVLPDLTLDKLISSMETGASNVAADVCIMQSTLRYQRQPGICHQRDRRSVIA